MHKTSNSFSTHVNIEHIDCKVIDLCISYILLQNTDGWDQLISYQNFKISYIYYMYLQKDIRKIWYLKILSLPYINYQYWIRQDVIRVQGKREGGIPEGIRQWDERGEKRFVGVW